MTCQSINLQYKILNSDLAAPKCLASTAVLQMQFGVSMILIEFVLYLECKRFQ